MEINRKKTEGEEERMRLVSWSSRLHYGSQITLEKPNLYVPLSLSSHCPLAALLELNSEFST